MWECVCDAGPTLTRRDDTADISRSRPQFGAIVAVSRAGSPRQPGLFLAANITELDITVPAQPRWTDDDVNALRADKGSSITRGSALAWLGHKNAMRWFLESDLETMLVLEDDVDWDIRLRTRQIPIAAQAIRRLNYAKTTPRTPIAYVPARNNYWSDSSTWDILYLGHCGDIFRPSSWTDNIRRMSWPDPTLPARREMHPYTAKFLESIDVPEQTRLIHESIFPLCTFGFALTRLAARRLLYEIAAREANGGTMAYDVRVLEGCRDLGLRCWSANPELFHHMDAESEIAQVNDAGEQAEKAGADGEGRLKPLRAGAAPNIACGARSPQFWTEDERTLEFLRQKVGREGVCLKDELEEGRQGGERYREGPGDPRLNN